MSKIPAVLHSPTLALLRGINVGGNNIIKMADLKAFFEKMGFGDVHTYIQSGNVIFTTNEKDKAKLTDQIEKALSKAFNYKSRVVLITQKELEQTIKKAPKNFGAQPEKYRYDVLFVKAPLTAKEAMKSITLKEGVDTADIGPHALYFSRLIAQATSSHLNKIVGTPLYQNITIRNWNTTTKLLALMEKASI